MTVLERTTHVTPLGVRFWDPVEGRAVSEGLVVRTGDVRAFPNRLGVFALRGIPGLREAESGAGDDAYWANPPVRRTITLDVDDELGRFQPFSFAADVPHRGLFELDCYSPVSRLAGMVELFSTPGRRLAVPAAVVRAELRDADRDRPAAWALVEVEAPGSLPARGLADVAGRIVVFLPYPEPGPISGSPLETRGPLAAEEWAVDLRVFYEPLDPVPGRPDLCTALNQRGATLVAGLSPFSTLTEATIAYGRELVVRSAECSVLFVTAAP